MSDADILRKEADTPAAKRIRIVLAALPAELHRVLKRAAAESGMVVTGGPECRGVDVLFEVQNTNADAIVTGMRSGGIAVDYSHFFGEFPHLKILAVDPEAHEASLHELRRHSTVLKYGSPADLVATIQAAIRAEEEAL